MPKRAAAESFEEYLEHGKRPLARQLMAWMSKENGRTGPWTIRMTTEAEGMPHTPIYQQVFEEVHPDLVPGLIEDLRQRVFDRHGPLPMCKIRFQAYHEGESADSDAHIIRTQSVAPSPMHGPSGIEFGNNEYAWGVVAMFVNSHMQTQAQLVNALGHSNALAAALSQQLTTISSVRSVGTTTADMSQGGPFGMIGSIGAAAFLAYFWPDIQKVFEDRKDGDSTLAGLLRLFSATTQQAIGATKAATATEQAMNAGLLGDYGDIDDLEPVTFSWTDEDGTEHIGEVEGDFGFNGAAPPPKTSSKVLDIAHTADALEDDPGQLAALLDNAGPKAKAWLLQNLATLAPKLT